MSDKVPRMKGGAVMDERSPLKDAIDCTTGKQQLLRVWHQLSTFKKEDQEPLFCGDTPAPSSLDEPDMVVFREGDMVDRKDRCEVS